MNLSRRVLKFLTVSLLLLTAGMAMAFAPICAQWLGGDRPWLESEQTVAVTRLLRNISPSEARPGAIVAAQTREKPNYYYHWVRDAGIVMEAVLQRLQLSTDAEEKATLTKKFNEYLNFSEQIQNAPAKTGLGEPKFNIDGTAYNGPWGRPQNDGPALRAISFIHWAHMLNANGQGDLVRKKLYDGKGPDSSSIIKKDLEYIAHHWRDPSFDIWEEVLGDHFYTRMVQRRALLEGAKLAHELGDVAAADFYYKQGKEIEKDLENFWDPSAGHFVATRNRVGGLDYKKSGLDTAVILGLLHGGLGDGFIPFNSQRVEATIEKLVAAFKRNYSINKMSSAPGVAVGRYPEDLYGGADFSGGNPWPLCTLAIGEAYFRAAAEAHHEGKSQVSGYFISLGDYYVDRVRFHAHTDGSLNEQINRDWGYMTSVSDLTWNYAAIITTYFARATAIRP